MSDFPVTSFRVADLKPHPRNYKVHPASQINHIVASIEANGVYRNIVVARDNTILAGHGVVLAMKRLGREMVPGYRLDIDPLSAKALKVLAGDNEIAHLGELDDRLLSELLKEIREGDDLLGTGYDDLMLANLVMVTRPASEIRDFDEAAQWVGMPEYEPGGELIKVVVSFRNEADRDRFLQEIGSPQVKGWNGKTWSVWWPDKADDDNIAVRWRG